MQLQARVAQHGRQAPRHRMDMLFVCRNGPGVFEIGGQELAHPFDGHGLVASIGFRGGRAFMRSRFVRTEECAAPLGALLAA